MPTLGDSRVNVRVSIQGVNQGFEFYEVKKKMLHAVSNYKKRSYKKH